MKFPGKSFTADTNLVGEIPFPIPGSTPGLVTAQLINVDVAKGLVTTVIHIHPGGMIPAHYHNDGAEAHYVLEGDFINAGVVHGPGGFVTHPAGVVHGPHGSRTGCRVLTMQTSFVDPAKPDFHLAEEETIGDAAL